MIKAIIFLMLCGVFLAQTKEEKRLTSPQEIAEQAIKAHGGEKFKQMRSLIIRGNGEVSGSPTATFPATFLTIFSGDKYLLEISNPLQPFKQVYDGVNTYSTIRNFSLPPINRIGLQLLQKVGQEGFIVSELPEKSKKKLGFRITSPEGYYTDFFLDEKTKRVKAYEASYLVQNRTVTTAVEIDKFREVEGVIIPERYAQRFDIGTFTIYLDFKAKEILVNTEIDEEIFSSFSLR